MSVDYDELWREQWGEMQDFGPVHRHSARVIVDLLRPLKVRSLVDVGCGNGANLVHIQRALGVGRVVGLDVSPEALAVASQRVEGEFHAFDVTADTLHRTFDAVLCAQVIEHVEDDEAFLAKLRAMTERYCIVATMQGRMRPSEHYVGHKRNYTRAELEAKLGRAGFDVAHVVEWGFPFYSPLYRSAIELVGGQAAPVGGRGFDRWVARALSQLYKLNRSTKGDVITVLARASTARRP
jgi:SAM-dependent methyltransferase